jgi:putative membrane protein
MPPPPVAEQEQHLWHRLNARMIIVRPIHEIVGFLPVLAVLVFSGGGDIQRLWWGLAGIGMLLLRGLLVWAVTTYRVTEEQVELRDGLLSRRKRSVRRGRIRTVEANAKFGHRMFGLAEVRIGTGEHEQKRGGTFNLDAVTAAEAERLRKVLLRRKQASQSVEGQPAASESTTDKAGKELARLDLAWLRYAPLTLSGLAAVGALVGVSFRTLDELNLEPSRIGTIRDVFDWVNNSPALEVLGISVVAVVVLSTIGSLLGYVFGFWNYQLTREPDGTLRVRRGLFTTRSVSIEEARLRGVVLRQQLLLRAGGGGRLVAISTGLGSRGESNLLLPPAPVAEANRVAGAALGVADSPFAAPLRSHPRAALQRRLVRATAPVLLLAAALGMASLLAGAPAWQWEAALCLLPFAALLAVDRYRSLGHQITGHYLVTRSGSLRRQTAAVQREGIIGWRVRRSFFQRRARLVTVTAITAAGAFEVIDVPESDGVSLAEQALPGVLGPFVLRSND